MSTKQAAADARRNAAVLAAGGPSLYFVKHEGRAFKRARLTDEEQAIVVRAIGRKRFRMRECFYNAQRIVQDDESEQIVYVEGYRASVPYGLHAWAAINGKVIDVTVLPEDADIVTDTPLLRRVTTAAIKPLHHMGLFPAGEGYRGVAFSRSVWRAPSFRAGNSLLDNWQVDWPAENGSLDAFRVSTKGKK